MAINIPILTEFQDNGIKAAKAAFANFKSAVGDAQGGLNKFKAGSKSVMDSVAANSTAFAVAGGIAFAKFAADGITAFKDLALQAQDFANRTGAQVEDASRWVEVAGDLGVNVDSVQTAMGKMNTVIGMNPTLFKDLGVDIEYTNTGALDVNATFLNTIQHLKDITDPAQRAKEGVKLLGKQWKDVSGLIELGAGTLKDSLAKVSDQKVISSEEVDKARAFRDAMDQLRDKMQDVGLEIGQDLIPMVTGLLELLAKLPPIFRGAAGQVELSDEQMAEFGDQAAKTRIKLKEMADLYSGYVASRIAGATIMVDNQRLSVDELDVAWETLKGHLNLESAVASTETTLSDLKQKGIDAFNGVDGAVGQFTEDLITAQLKVLRLAETVTMSDFEKNKIRILVESGDIANLEYATKLIEAIGSGYGAEAVSKAAAIALEAGRGLSIPHRAGGGPVVAGSPYLVGERGMELFTPSTSGTITPNSSLGGATVNVTVTSANPDDVVSAIQKWVRQNGSLPLAVTSGIRY